jgi:hypothetical protein
MVQKNGAGQSIEDSHWDWYSKRGHFSILNLYNMGNLGMPDFDNDRR